MLCDLREQIIALTCLAQSADKIKPQHVAFPTNVAVALYPYVEICLIKLCLDVNYNYCCLDGWAEQEYLPFGSVYDSRS
jgi:hypothetical protein